jgi:hypothetical protein
MAAFVKPKVKRNDIRAKHAELNYMKNNLMFYINKNKHTTRTNKGYWSIEEDHATLFKLQILQFIIDHFNLYELYVVFFNPTYSNIHNARKEAIDNINKDDSLTPEEVKQLKQKIRSMHTVFFGLILEFTNNSELFKDKYHDNIVYPKYTL